MTKFVRISLNGLRDVYGWRVKACVGEDQRRSVSCVCCCVARRKKNKLRSFALLNGRLVGYEVSRSLRPTMKQKRVVQHYYLIAFAATLCKLE